MMFRCFSAALAVLLCPLVSALPAIADAPENYLFSGPGELGNHIALLKRDDIGGIQIVYNWRMLEPSYDRYDFSAIETDLATLDGMGKKLFVQVQDRFFSNKARNLPGYILNDPEYGGGLISQVDRPGDGKAVQQGWAAIQWNDALHSRFQALLTALADRFDGRIHGINLPESAIDIDMQAAEKDTGFSCDAYVNATLDNIAYARSVFQASHVVQYVNFWPCEWNNDKGYMKRTFETAVAEGFGLGGPDIVPNRRAQEKNSYPFFHAYKDRLSLIAMAVQQPTLTYRNPKTGKPFTKEEFTDYASGYLGVDLIFWTPDAPWLKN